MSVTDWRVPALFTGLSVIVAVGFLDVTTAAVLVLAVYGVAASVRGAAGWLRRRWRMRQLERCFRRQAIARHPAVHTRGLPGCQCTPCRVLRSVPQTLTAPSPPGAELTDQERTELELITGRLGDLERLYDALSPLYAPVGPPEGHWADIKNAIPQATDRKRSSSEARHL